MKIRAKNIFNDLSKKIQAKQFVQVEKSVITNEKLPYEYKSNSKLRKIFSPILGDVLECNPPSGFKRIAKINRHGVKTQELKFYPNMDKYIETKFEKNGKAPKIKIIRIKDNNGIYQVEEIIKYKDGKDFYSFINNFDETYTVIQEISRGEVYIQKGKILPDGGLAPETNERWLSPDFVLDSVKPKQKYKDGAILQIKAKDIDKYRAGVRKKILNEEYNTGSIIFENLKFRSLRAKALRSPSAIWADLNLKNWGFNYSLSKGNDPEDILNVYVARSEAAMNNLSPLFKFEKFLANAYANMDISLYFRRINDSRRNLNFIDNLIQGVPLKPKMDPDFQKAAGYLKYASLNDSYNSMTKELAQELSLKPIEYKPQTDIVARNAAKAKAKAQKRARFEEKQRVKAEVKQMAKVQ